MKMMVSGNPLRDAEVADTDLVARCRNLPLIMQAVVQMLYVLLMMPFIFELVFEFKRVCCSPEFLNYRIYSKACSYKIKPQNVLAVWSRTSHQLKGGIGVMMRLR